MKINVLSLFDGISCGHVALERAGVEVDKYFASEIDKYAIKVAMKNYPDTIQLGDVRKIEINSNSFESNNTIYSGKFTDLYRNTVIDLLIGCSPCQDLSIVKGNKRDGINGEKSSLFFEYVRILGECNPKYFLFENVASMSKNDMNTISECLGVNPIILNSNSFVPQNRERAYWTNIPVEGISFKCNLALEDILEKNVDEKYYYKKPFSQVDLTKPICCNIEVSGHDILKRVMNPKFKSSTLTCCRGGNTQKKVFVNDRVRKLTPIEYERLQGLPDNYTNILSDSQRYNCIGNGWTVDVIAHILKGIIKRRTV